MAILGDFNSPLTSMDKSSRKKINTATEILNDTIERLDLKLIFSQDITLKKKIRICVLFKCTWKSLKDRPCSAAQN